MKKQISILIIFLVFLNTGCIELIEEIKINSDKSGSIAYKLNFGGIGSILNELSGFTGSNWQSQVEEEAQKFVRLLESQQGIRNINFTICSYSDDYELSFDFENAKSLNSAIYAMGGNKKTFFSPSYIKISKNRFKRINFSPWIGRYLKKESIELPTSNFSGIIYYNSVIHVPKTVIKISDGSAKLAPGKKTVSKQFDLQKIIDNKVNTGIKIKF